jgi:hypothetical protein
MHNRTQVGPTHPRRRTGWIAAAIALIATGLLYLGVPRVLAQAQTRAVANHAMSTLRFDGESGSSEDFTQYRDTEIAILRSRPILEAALQQHPELINTAALANRAEPVEWLVTKLEVHVIPNTRLVNIALDSPVRKESAAIIDAVVGAYLRSASDELTQSYELRIRNFQVALDAARKDAENRRRELRRAEDSARDDAIIEVRRGLEIQDLREIRQAIRKLLVDKAAAEAILARRKSDKEPNQFVITPLEDHIAALSAQISMLSHDEEKGLAVLQKLEPSRVDFHRLKKDVERAEETATAIETESDRVSRETRSTPSRVKVISPAK